MVIPHEKSIETFRPFCGCMEFFEIIFWYLREIFVLVGRFKWREYKFKEIFLWRRPYSCSKA
jgi:hypothetical protein